MTRKVLHKQVYKDFSGGTYNTTICGRSNNSPQSYRENDGNNVTTKDEEVTCKFCLKIMDAKRGRGE